MERNASSVHSISFRLGRLRSRGLREGLRLKKAKSFFFFGMQAVLPFRLVKLDEPTSFFLFQNFLLQLRGANR